MKKKLWAAILALAVFLGLTTVSALADVMENIQVSGIEYYDSGYLKEFTMTYDVEPYLASANCRVSIQTEKFSGERDGRYPFGDLRNNGKYWSANPYTDWPTNPDACGFVAWSGGTFYRPASGQPTTPLTISFPESAIDCNVRQTYYLYVWANYGGRVYPDAYVMQFTTGGASIAVSTAKPGTAATAAPTQAPTATPTQAPTAAPTQAPTATPTQAPTAAPTAAPTQAPTAAPTQAPTATPVVKPANMPKTGDHSSLALWVTLGLLSGCSMLALARKGRKDR